MYSVLCASAHHDVTYFELMECLEIKRSNISRMRHEVTLNKRKS